MLAYENEARVSSAKRDRSEEGRGERMRWTVYLEMEQQQYDPSSRKKQQRPIGRQNWMNEQCIHVMKWRKGRAVSLFNSSFMLLTTASLREREHRDNEERGGREGVWIQKPQRDHNSITAPFSHCNSRQGQPPTKAERQEKVVGIIPQPTLSVCLIV